MGHKILTTQTTRIGNQVNELIASAELFTRGKEQKITDINGNDPESQMLTFGMYSEAVDNDDQFVGPLVGRVEFGSGGGKTEFEFDLPSPTQISPNVSEPAILKPNGVIITVPASRVAVFARNDNRSGLNLIDPVVGASIGITGNAARVGVFNAYGLRPSVLYRTLVWASDEQPAFGNQPIGPVPLTNIRIMPIPAFARDVVFLRTPMTAALEVVCATAWGGNHGPHSVPAGVVGADTNPLYMALSPYDRILSVTNLGPGVITNGFARFRLSL